MSSRTDIDVAGARRRVATLAARTPLVPSLPLSDRVGVEVFLKLESVQPTGTFKVRGAASKILALTDEERRRGVVTASTGNHGRAVAYVARRLGIPATVCVSSGVPVGKLSALEDLDAELEVVGDSQSEALARAGEIARDRGMTFVHPFDDRDVIAGQASIGVEVAEELPTVSTVLVPLSGGGLLAGVAMGLEAAGSEAETIGVSMTRAPMMAMSLEAGHPIEVPEEETLADSLRGGVGLDNRLTFELVAALTSRVALVDETLIWDAMRFLFERHRLVVEGAGAIGVGSLLSGALEPLQGPVAVIISGANAEPEHVAGLLAGDPAPTV